MNQQNEAAVVSVSSPHATILDEFKLPRAWLIAAGTLVLLFSWPLYQLVRLSFKSELYSHLTLVPLVSAYLAWSQRRRFMGGQTAERWLATLLYIGGGLALTGWLILTLSGGKVPSADALALSTSSFVLLVWGISATCLSRSTLHGLAFPLLFLVFLIPMPTAVVQEIESLLQHGSASAAFSMFELAGTPVFHHDLVFQLPGIALEVAPECSGIRSTLALFITSTVAAFLYLRSPWKRAMLVAAVLPLALLRNGFRVFTIGELCVHVSPDMIHSYIHHHGGPIFFALSLIPFFLVLVLLKRSERGQEAR